VKNHSVRWVWMVVIGISMLGLYQVAWTEEQKIGSSTSEENTTGNAPAAESKPGAEPAVAPQASNTGTEPAASSQESAAAPAAGTGTAAPAAGGMVSVDFKDADIRQVLRIISLKSGVDIVAGADVEGLVTIKLTNVPWDQALNIILRTYGFTYAREGNIVRVMTLKALEGEALSTRVFPLDYAKAKEVPDVIKEMLSDRGRVKFDERTNTIIVTDIPANLFQIQEVVERLDRRTPQVLIETRIVETKLEKNENLGLDWSDSFSLTAASATAPSTFPFPKNAELGKLGHLFLTNAGTVTSGVFTNNQFYDPTRRGALIPNGGGTFTFGTLTSSGLQMVMNALRLRTDTNIVSNPNITVLNNQEAKIHIGEEYPVPTYTIDPTTGRTSISGYTPKLTGTILTVTPHVNPSEEIVVDLEPSIVAVGTNVSYSLGSGNSVDFPRFTTQTAKTHVRIRNTQTVAIGGLVKKSEAKVETKVPMLADIPLVGLFFKNTRWYSGGSDPNRQDVLIFLTVSLTKEDLLASRKVAAASESSSP